MATSLRAAFASALILREANDMLVIGPAGLFGPLSLHQSVGIEGEVRRRLLRHTADPATMQAIRRWVHETGFEPRLSMSTSKNDVVDHILIAIDRRRLTARVLSTESFDLPNTGVIAPQYRPVAAPQTRSVLTGDAPAAGFQLNSRFEVELREKLGEQLFQTLVISTALPADFLRKPVGAMTTHERLAALLLLTAVKLPGEIADEFIQLLLSIGIMRIILIVLAWVASHAVIIGEIIDVALIGLLLWGIYSNLRAIRDGAEQFYEAVTTAIDARTDPELDRAAMLMASAVGILGVSVIAAMMGRAGKKGGAAQPKPNAEAQGTGGTAPPPSRPPASPEKSSGDSARPPEDATKSADATPPKRTAGPKIGPGRPFSKKQKEEIIAANREKNDGVVRSDKSGQELVPPKKSQKGVTPDPNEWQIDHRIPRSKGGSNDPDTNADVLSRKENRDKSDKMDDP